MKVLLWSPAGAGLHYGGGSMNAYRLYASAGKGLFQPTLVHACPYQEPNEVFEEIVDLGPLDHKSPLSMARYLWRSRQWLKTNASRFDVFHGIAPYEPTLNPAAYAQKLGLPSFVKPTSHLSGFSPVDGWKKALRLPQKRRRKAKKLSGLIAISSAIENELLGYGIDRGKVFAIPNGVDVEKFKPAGDAERETLRREFSWDSEDVVILYVGTLRPRKQPAFLLSSLIPLFRTHPHLRIAYVGPAHEERYLRELETLASENGVSDRVQFFGMRKDIDRFYRAADIYCLPSLSEGMPNAVLEAMASGLPALVTPISGSEDLVCNDVNGYLIETPADLQKAVASYCAAPEKRKRHGEASRTLAETKYSTGVIARAHFEVFEKASVKRRR